MRISTFLTAIILSVFAFTGKAQSNVVMSWVATYGITESYAHLTNDNKTTWLKDGLTHIGLQFWVPGDDGKVEQITKYQFAWLGNLDDDINDFAQWGDDNGVNIMLCFHNVRAAGWDWEIARKAYFTNPDTTVKHLLATVEQYGLEGVDIDFEAGGDYLHEKPEFVYFMQALGDSLHAHGKILSIDLISTPCYHSPGPTWEGDLAPHVDFMNVMGYYAFHEQNEETFSWCPVDQTQTNQTVFKYSYVHDYAVNNQGVDASKINVGIPAWNDNGYPNGEWGGQDVNAHLADIQNISGDMGIAIWDLRLGAGNAWHEESTWENIERFKNGEALGVENNVLESGALFVADYETEKVVVKENIQVDIYSLTGRKVSSKAVKMGSVLELPSSESRQSLLMIATNHQGQMQRELLMAH